MVMTVRTTSGRRGGPDGSTPGTHIGTLAAELGLNPKTIRYYEEIGLLPPPTRTVSGYRLYGDADRERLRFILKSRALGLTLAEIREVLNIRESGERPCIHVLKVLERKVAEVDRQMRALADFRRDLIGLRRQARRTMTGEACVCGIIEAHQGTGR